ncbi:MAG: hypothetical protein CVU11_06655 [Bacteroidetes bacterium HGW-Bacteroidetes-6]|jgi:hypothetical protein|nr:MAG: hypothetical protein CVU11_06655 [Bacteroidetes bacterium HGW-Bacteroidetes-6]
MSGNNLTKHILKLKTTDNNRCQVVQSIQYLSDFLFPSKFFFPTAKAAEFLRGEIAEGIRIAKVAAIASTTMLWIICHKQ